VIVLSPEADFQLNDLTEHYERKDRLAASRNLLRAVESAKLRIGRAPSDGYPALRPYPELKVLELRWILERHYWISYTPTDPPVIAGIFHETADIPNRI
jgi:plasmid stabilization system protein ParE